VEHDADTTKITELDANDVLADLAYIVDGNQSGQITYTAQMAGGALRVTAADKSGASRTFELDALSLREAR
jgi:hypothetical protein